LAGYVVKRHKRAKKWPKNGRKVVEKRPEKKLGGSRNEAPICVVYTAHFGRKMFEKYLLLREKK
jgi:hypothetical protein